MRLQNNLFKEVVEESRGKWVDVVKKMGKQMDNFVSQGEARERATHSYNARIIRFDETEGETAQQLLDKVNSQERTYHTIQRNRR